jgi:hypothetical protein
LSSWDTSSGLLEEFSLDVQEAWFGTNDKYNQGQTLLLNLKGAASVAGDVVDPDHHLMLSCGDKWKAAQGGATAVNTTGSDSFNSQSAVGRLIDGAKELGDPVIAILRGRGDSFQADTWNNLVIDFERVKTGSFKDRNTGEERDVYNYLPRAIVEGSGGGASASTPAPAAAAADNSGGGMAPAALRKILGVEAAKYDSNDDFMAAVLDDGYSHGSALTSNEELLDAVIDGSIYAEAN